MKQNTMLEFYSIKLKTNYNCKNRVYISR